MFVEQLPIPQATKLEQEHLSKMVSHVLEKRKKGEISDDIEESIDEFVYKLYQITRQEVEILLSVSKK
jgi:hypothetical protein